jgi:hypothetical protein
MSEPTAIDLTAKLWRNGSDGEPQLTVMLPDGRNAWLRVPRSSAQAYAECVAALDAQERAGAGLAARMDDFEWYKVASSEPEAEEGAVAEPEPVEFDAMYEQPFEIPE